MSPPPADPLTGLTQLRYSYWDKNNQGYFPEAYVDPVCAGKNIYLARGGMNE